MYYEEIDRSYYSYGTLAAQDYRLANPVPGRRRTTEELMWIFRKGRGQTRTKTNFMGTDHLVPERGHYKAVFSKKLKRTKDYNKGMPIFINFLCHRIHHVIVKICQVCIKVYQPNVLINKH